MWADMGGWYGGGGTAVCHWYCLGLGWGGGLWARGAGFPALWGHGASCFCRGSLSHDGGGRSVDDTGGGGRADRFCCRARWDCVCGWRS